MTNEKDKLTRIIAAILAAGGTILFVPGALAMIFSVLMLVMGILGLLTFFLGGVVTIFAWACVLAIFAIGSRLLIGYFCRADETLPIEKMNPLWICTMIYNLAGALFTVWLNPKFDSTTLLVLFVWQVLAFCLAAIAFQRDFHNISVAETSETIQK